MNLLAGLVLAAFLTAASVVTNGAAYGSAVQSGAKFGLTSNPNIHDRDAFAYGLAALALALVAGLALGLAFALPATP